MLTLALGCATGPATCAAFTTVDEWRNAAAQDLAGIHDILTDSSPAMVVDRDSQYFRMWIEQGLAEARASLDKVNDERGYFYALQGYAAGFRDAHIFIRPTLRSHIQTESHKGSAPSLPAIAWPGFVLGFHNGGYEVAARSSNTEGLPPLHAQLEGCDGETPDQLVKAHDRYDGDFTLASVRVTRAADLLLDRGNPFIARPTACTFLIPGHRENYKLVWRAFDTTQAERTNPAHEPQQLGLAPWRPNRWWLTLPSMDPDQDWNAFYRDVRVHLKALREADALVLDLRGNDGGSGAYGDRLARLLWGDAFVNARRPLSGPVVWRASAINRDYWAHVVKQVAQSKNDLGQYKGLVQQELNLFDQALAQGASTFREDGEEGVKRSSPGPDLVRARVILLTDQACVSACLDLMDELKAFPGVTQAGTETSADSIFMELTLIPSLPSGMSAFGFGHKAWIHRPRGSGVPYRPSPEMTWAGEPGDEAGLRLWLAAALQAPASSAGRDPGQSATTAPNPQK